MAFLSSNMKEKECRSTSKLQILGYYVFGLTIFFKPGDPYLWEVSTSPHSCKDDHFNQSQVCSNISRSDLVHYGKGISTDDTLNVVIPAYYATNVLLSIPVYILVQRFGWLKSCLIMHAVT